MSVPGTDCTLAIVTPWFGRELRGGAELQAWNLATRLCARGRTVEVLTTCCRSFQDDWSDNHFEAGVAAEPEGFLVRRFPVERRDRTAFDRVCGHLLSLKPDALKPGVSPITPADEQIFREHLIRSPALLNHLATSAQAYSAFIFLPYLYGPILDGLPLVASRALLQPCLHDEAYAYLRSVQHAFFSAAKLLWNSEGEQELGRRLFGPGILAKSITIGEGVETIQPPRQASSAELAALAPFVLMLGRKDPGKGSLLARDAFRRFRSRASSQLQLVIAGAGELDLSDPANGIHDLGLVSEEVRSWLLHQMVALVQPSPNESFSRVMFEAWQCGKPVLVRRSCLATARAVESCSGGWSAETEDEWAELFHDLTERPPSDCLAAGARGAAFAAEVADWDKVIDRYEAALAPFSAPRGSPLNVALTLSCASPQRVTVRAERHVLGQWDLTPGMECRTGPLEHAFRTSPPRLRLETTAEPQRHPPDPRLIGFRLNEFQVEDASGDRWLADFGAGWHRTEGPIGSDAPRWSTGSAEVVLRPAQQRETIAVHQVLPNLSYGDAIGNHTLWIRQQLRAMGYSSEIFARHIAPNMLDQAHAFSGPAAVPADAAIIYHHSIGTEITPWVCEHPGPKALIYHNITPAEFFEPYRPDFAEICRRGRDELPALAAHFPVSVGDSSFNAAELKECGFDQPGVLPLCIDPAHWSFPPDEQVMAELQDGCTNILFVGRIVPNKRQEDLIYTFKFWLEDDPTARLWLIGSSEVSSFYRDCLQELARRLRVDHAVRFVGQVNDAQLHAYYRCATMFWCFSEHEGFCVPVIEACAFGVPVVARAEGALPETLGEAGIWLKTRGRPDANARAITAAIRSVDGRRLAARVAHYGPARVTGALQDLLQRLLKTSSALLTP